MATVFELSVDSNLKNPHMCSGLGNVMSPVVKEIPTFFSLNLAINTRRAVSPSLCKLCILVIISKQRHLLVHAHKWDRLEKYFFVNTKYPEILSNTPICFLAYAHPCFKIVPFVGVDHGWTVCAYHSHSFTPLLSWAGERKWKCQDQDRERSLTNHWNRKNTQHVEINLIYYQWNQSRKLRDNTKS